MTRSWLACTSDQNTSGTAISNDDISAGKVALDLTDFSLVNLNSILDTCIKSLTAQATLDNATILRLQTRILRLQDQSPQLSLLNSSLSKLLDDFEVLNETASDRAKSIIDLTTANSHLQTKLDNLKASSATDLLNATQFFEDYQEEVGLGFTGLLSNQSTTMAKLSSKYHNLFTQAREDHLTAATKLRKAHDAALLKAQSNCKVAKSALKTGHKTELNSLVSTHAEETKRLQESRDTYECDAIEIRNLTEQSSQILQKQIRHNANVCVNKTRIARAGLQTCLQKNHPSRRRRCPPEVIHAGLFDITTIVPYVPAPVDPVPTVSSTMTPISTLLTKMPTVTTEEADRLVDAQLDEDLDGSGSGDTDTNSLQLSTQEELASPSNSRHS